MIKFAITGNIASGKSEVEKLLSKKFPVYDTDKIAHEILNSIDYFFGYDVFTEGKIDRTKLGKLVFENPDIKSKLEDLLHPKIKEKLLEIFEKEKNSPYLFVSVPLLFEAHFDELFDKIIIVTVSEETRLQRLIKRNNYSPKEAEIRIKSQQDEAEKIAKCDFVINNDSDLENLKHQIDEFCKKILN